MTAPVLDEIDRSILALLQENGRMSNVDLAREVGLTAPPCLRRVRALEDRGLITAYHAALNGPALGYSITVFAMVSLKSQAEHDLKNFEDHVAAVCGDSYPSVSELGECHVSPEAFVVFFHWLSLFSFDLCGRIQYNK